MIHWSVTILLVAIGLLPHAAMAQVDTDRPGDAVDPAGDAASGIDFTSIEFAQQAGTNDTHVLLVRANPETSVDFSGAGTRFDIQLTVDHGPVTVDGEVTGTGITVESSCPGCPSKPQVTASRRPLLLAVAFTVEAATAAPVLQRLTITAGDDEDVFDGPLPSSGVVADPNGAPSAIIGPSDTAAAFEDAPVVADPTDDAHALTDFESVRVGRLGDVIWVSTPRHDLFVQGAHWARTSFTIALGDTTIRASQARSRGFVTEVRCTGPLCPPSPVPRSTQHGPGQGLVTFVEIPGLSTVVDELEVALVDVRLEAALSDGGPIVRDRLDGTPLPLDLTQEHHLAPASSAMDGETSGGATGRWLLVLLGVLVLLVGGVVWQREAVIAFVNARSPRQREGRQIPEPHQPGPPRGVRGPVGTTEPQPSTREEPGPRAVHTPVGEREATPEPDARVSEPAHEPATPASEDKPVEPTPGSSPAPSVVGPITGGPAASAADDPCADVEHTWQQARSRCEQQRKEHAAAERARDDARAERDEALEARNALFPEQPDEVVELAGGLRLTRIDIGLRRWYAREAWEAWEANPSPETVRRLEEAWQQFETPAHRSQRLADARRLSAHVAEAEARLAELENEVSAAAARERDACAQADEARSLLDDCRDAADPTR